MPAQFDQPLLRAVEQQFLNALSMPVNGIPVELDVHTIANGCAALGGGHTRLYSQTAASRATAYDPELGRIVVHPAQNG